MFTVNITEEEHSHRICVVNGQIYQTPSWEESCGNQTVHENTTTGAVAVVCRMQTGWSIGAVPLLSLKTSCSTPEASLFCSLISF